MKQKLIGGSQCGTNAFLTIFIGMSEWQLQSSFECYTLAAMVVLATGM